MKIHLDACISAHLGRALRELERRPGGPEICIHEEEFSPDTKDVDWIPKLKSLGVTILITADARIFANPDERRAWNEAGILTYFVSSKFASSSAWVQVEELISWWPHIIQHARKASPGSAWRLPWNEKRPVQMDGRGQSEAPRRHAVRPRQ